MTPMPTSMPTSSPTPELAAIAPVLVLGTGALAKLVAFRLAAAAGGAGPDGRPPVTLAGSWEEALAAIEARGITVEEADGREDRVRVATLRRAELAASLGDGAAPPPRFRLVLVLVKSRQTAAVAPLAAAALAPGGRILSLQNGLGHRELLAAAAADGTRVLAGVTALGATGLGPDRVRAVGRGETLLGPSRGPGLDAEAIAAAFRAAGLPCRVAPDLEALLWRKLAVSAAINPLTALGGRPNGAILTDPLLRALALEAAHEAAAVAAAEGVDLGAEDPADWVLAVAERTAANRSSMLQDLDRGAPTEIEAICGALLERGARHGLDLPLCRWLLAAVRGLEAGGRREDLVWPRPAATPEDRPALVLEAGR